MHSDRSQNLGVAQIPKVAAPGHNNDTAYAAVLGFITGQNKKQKLRSDGLLNTNVASRCTNTDNSVCRHDHPLPA